LNEDIPPPTQTFFSECLYATSFTSTCQGNPPFQNQLDEGEPENNVGEGDNNEEHINVEFDPGGNDPEQGEEEPPFKMRRRVRVSEEMRQQVVLIAGLLEHEGLLKRFSRSGNFLIII
jgi:hypothetical protein